MTGAERSVRRQGDDPRTAIVNAAGSMFERYGYARCSTRQLAEAAGVAEALLFRHFGSKAALFDLSVRRPFDGAVERFAARWRRWDTTTGEREERARRFTVQLCEFVYEQRETVLALMTVDAFEPGTQDLGAAVRRSVDVLLRLIDETVLTDTEGQRLPGLDPALSAPAVLATVLGALVLDDSLYADGAHAPSTASVTDEVVAMVLHGVSHRGRHRG